jgi:hypothetical protein
MAYFAQGFERELCSFLNGRDLDIRACALQSQAMKDLMTKAGNTVELCKQHGVKTENGAIVIELSVQQAQPIASASLEVDGLHFDGNTVMCTLPVLFKFSPISLGKMTGAPAP